MESDRDYPAWLRLLIWAGGGLVAYLALLFMVYAIGWGLMALDALTRGTPA